jgi:transposase
MVATERLGRATGRVEASGQKFALGEAQMFRMGASSLHHNRSVLGDFLRRMKAKLGPAAGITATAHKLAIIFYTVVTKQVEYDESIWAARDAQRQKRFEDKLKRQLAGPMSGQ